MDIKEFPKHKMKMEFQIQDAVISILDKFKEDTSVPVNEVKIAIGREQQFEYPDTFHVLYVKTVVEL